MEIAVAIAQIRLEESSGSGYRYMRLMEKTFTVTKHLLYARYFVYLG
jgi:hypothetical protein